MAEESTVRKPRHTNTEEESNSDWKRRATVIGFKATELLLSGLITGLGVACGQSLHKRISVIKKGADVHRLKVV